MTIIALLGHSLANLRRKSANLEQQKVLPSSERSYGFWTTLIAARMQEADLLASGYIQRPDDATAGEPVRQLNGWVFHR
ncbi:hypothetical protein AA309_18965 [Microvirga vignae]|uniref:Uncharacterized protein n=1 Tax=Microvirga vignae TaxID=1225564 RepID=A0A0H1R9X1_9HYPH|nr:hypothetical protein [Microvirga vignae]KLK91671.1 hypothetical protein AA309_18965 [Microvirga vignae]